MPVRLSLDFVGDRASVDSWGSMLRPSSHLLNLLDLEAVFVADLLV